MSFVSRHISKIDQNLYTIILNGDFNFPFIKWLKSECTDEIGSYRINAGSTVDEKTQAKRLLELTNEHFLTQIINNPTRKENILDLIFINSYEYVKNVQITDSGISDHKLVELTLDGKIVDHKLTENLQNGKPGSFRELNFFNQKINWEKIDDNLSRENWQHQIGNASCVQEAMELFRQILLRHCQKNIPKRRKQCKRSYYHSRRKLLMKRRTAKKVQLKRETVPFRIQQLNNCLVNIEKQIAALHDKEREENEQRAIENIKTNSRFFFSYAAKFSTSKSKIGPFLEENGDIIDDDKQMSEMLSKQYCSVFSTPVEEVSTELNNVNVEVDELTDLQITQHDIRCAIDELKVNSAAGPDEIPAILLKKCKGSLALPLSIIWRKSLNENDIPTDMKHAVIFPLAKGGSLTKPSNYRPVSLTSHVIKIFERVIKKAIVQHLENNILLNPNQHGFRSKRGTVTQLLEHYDKLLSSLCDNNCVDVIYLDFAKAFDKVDHKILLTKLNNIGIKGKLHSWLQSFLQNRTQSVLVNSEMSAPQKVLSGVPQGTVLGPILFLIMANDLSESCEHTTISCFADDTRVVATVKDQISVNNVQKDLDAISMWAIENNMTFNEQKFELLRYGRDKTLINNTNYYSGNGEIIEEKSNLRDLGIRMQNDASFDEHIAKIQATGRRWCSWVLRTFSSRHRDTMLVLWKQLILPRIEYCSPLWAPSKRKDLEKVESIQKTFTAKIEGMRDHNYYERLQILNMYSIQRRFERFIIICVWKILNGLTVNVNGQIQAKNNQRTGIKCVVNQIKCQGGRGMQTKMFDSFAVRGPRLFNAMPKYIRNICHATVEQFKHVLDKYLACIPDLPLISGYPHSGDNSLLERKPDENKLTSFLRAHRNCNSILHRARGDNTVLHLDSGEGGELNGVTGQAAATL